MEEMMYPIGIQSFERLRDMNCLYVDKTAYIKTLIETGTIYFLSRPRRFGKSLLLSTIKSFFEGRRDLFKGLSIDEWQDWGWESFPVIHIDLNAKDYTYKESLYEKINAQLVVYEERYDVSSPDLSLDQRFFSIIKKAYETTGLGVVVLIDEYDKPILDTLHDDGIKEMHRDTLRAFYATLKSSDQYLRFCFLTGVTKFGQMNVFSGLNNLQDISIANDFAGICGISEDELRLYFLPGVKKCAEEWGCTLEDAFAELKDYYDGYHFSPSVSVDIYNPWSTLNAIKSRFIDTYWNNTGGGLSSLYKLLENGGMPLNMLNEVALSLQALRGTNVNIADPIPVLYQTGYLTIKSYDRKSLMFKLKFPNKEVESGFVTGLLPAYSGMSPARSTFAVNEFVSDVMQGDADGFLKRMESFFEDFPNEHSLRKEEDFQNIMYCIAKMMGLQTQVERHSAHGSADMVIQTESYVYVMEFKVDRSPEEAMRQLEEKGYAKPFAKDPRRLIKVGVEFSTEKRNISRWLIKT